MDSLDEAIRGTLTFRVHRGGDEIAAAHHELRVLARDEWGGVSEMGELLPAFVTPNDPSLAPLLKSVAASLQAHGHLTALDGYQSGDPNRSYLLAAALWSAVAERSLTYANPPGSFERVGQKVRRVSAVLADELATCLDSTLLFAAGLEAMGLNAVLVMVEGHCFVGVWLVEKSLPKRITTDSSELRKASVANEMVCFETTLVTHQPPAMFKDAVNVAADAISESKEHAFVAAIDVARARMSQVRPLASHSKRSETVEDVIESGPLPLPASPGFEAPKIDDDPIPKTPAGRIERWQRKLLDLSLRNRLLNFRTNLQTVPVLCPDVSGLEDRLADGARLRLVSLVDENRVADRDSKVYQERTQKDVDQEFAKEALDREEIACQVGSGDLDRRLTNLYRKAKNDLAEGGSNTLYLAVGFLRWKQQATASKTYRAPLLLVPVKLTRRSASSPFYLSHHDDDVRFNATLLQLLKKDFDCDLTVLESDLPTDDSGVDVPKILERVRRAVRDIPGFEVVEEVAIGSFSFAKYLMWKDLVERVGKLEQNRVVRHLVRDPDKVFSSEVGTPMPTADEIDRRYRPSDIVHPLPADSSQLAAVMAASEGHDLVIVGPPGTGKSQTIANLIAQCLSVGKTVLFVAEKTAALDVVHRRLKEHGLGDCCVELHSNKAERKKVLSQLEASWTRRRRPTKDSWSEVSERLRIRRDQLNTYVEALHAEHKNGWTAYEAMGLVVHGGGAPPVPLDWPRTTTHSRDEYAELVSCIESLAMAWSGVPQDAPVGRVSRCEWSMSWEADFLAACESLEKTSTALLGFTKEMWTTLGVSLGHEIHVRKFPAVFRFASELATSQLPPSGLLLNEELTSLVETLEVRKKLLEERDFAEQRLNSSVAKFAEMLDGHSDADVPESRRPALYRLANELVGGELPLDALVFHEEFDAIPDRLKERRDLLLQQEEARQGVYARQYDPALTARMSISKIEAAWIKARSSFWPLSAIRTKSVVKQLKAYMSVGGEPNPELDVTLLREFDAYNGSIEQNIDSLGLPETLQSVVQADATGLDSSWEDASDFRSKLQKAGVSLKVLKNTSGGSLEKVRETAKELYRPARMLEQAKKQLEENSSLLNLDEELTAKVNLDASALNEPIQEALKIRKAANEAGLGSEDLGCVAGASRKARVRCVTEFRQSAKSFTGAWKSYAKLAGIAPASNDTADMAGDAQEQAKAILGQRSSIKPWLTWNAASENARRLGLQAFQDCLTSGECVSKDLPKHFQTSYATWWLPIIVDQSESLRKFAKLHHEEAIREFCKLDEMARKASAPRAKQTIYHDLPGPSDVPRKSELGLLRHQMGLKRPSKSIREVISGMPSAFGKLAPCLMMAPLSIAQYLPADQESFDVVVFDEASQIPTWDAIGAIARGKQTIIVGDPKQLPPTNFFGKADDDEENDEIDESEKDLESILDEAQASGLPTMQLNWHYRSRHESLIAFSNWNYYNNELVTFPSAESEDRGVSLIPVPDGIYDRGKSRTNRAEADAIVSDLVSRMKRCLHRPEEQRLTYGVVTFNSQQQTLIQDLLDEALRQSPELEWFFSDDRVEATAVKNLENVQGDERDVMYFSITFGKDAAGKFPVDFGAINRTGGERRLNVAITRARLALRVYATFLPDEIRAERSAARGVHDLKAFLNYADRGFRALVERDEGSLGDYDSPFEEAVAECLIENGWRVEPQIGVSGFRIDLGIVHPDRPEKYLAGVECDGATYHRSAVARDRDKTRQLVLEGLGWKIVRVWSTDWWYSKDAALEALLKELEELYQVSNKETGEHSNDEVTDEGDTASNLIDAEVAIAPVLANDSGHIKENTTETADRAIEPTSATEGATINENSSARPTLVAKSTSSERRMYRVAMLEDVSDRQAQFFDDDYTKVVRELALEVIKTEGPVRDDLVAKRIARAHDFARTGAKIKQRVLAAVPELTTTKEAVGTFFWPDEKSLQFVPFRYADETDERRSLDQIAIEEIVGLIRAERHLLKSEDPALTFARELGLARLAKSSRERLEAAIELVESDDTETLR